MAILGDGYGSVGSCGQSVTCQTNTTQTLTDPSRAMYFSAAGTFNYQLVWNTVSQTITVVAGAWLPIRVKTIYAAPASTIAFW